MSQIHIPDALVEQIVATGLVGGAIEEFVQQAIRDKLAERSRPAMNGNTLDAFEALCDETAISAASSHLTRDQLHERD